jgi:hypothetical protein
MFRTDENVNFEDIYSQKYSEQTCNLNSDSPSMSTFWTFEKKKKKIVN